MSFIGDLMDSTKFIDEDVKTNSILSLTRD